jgi:hypothetical protein
MPIFPVMLLVAALIPAATLGTALSRADRDQFDMCYGSFEGAQTVLRDLEADFDPAYYREVGDAMEDLGADLANLDARLAEVGLAEDRTARERGHLAGRLAWTKPENHTLNFWAQNGPMSRPCFDLLKKLNQTLGP